MKKGIRAATELEVSILCPSGQQPGIIAGSGKLGDDALLSKPGAGATPVAAEGVAGPEVFERGAG
jgi:hypothetical protein